MEKMRMVAPVGKMPELDKNLKRMLCRLPKRASISEYCKTVDKWESIIILKDREAENKAKSCQLKPL